MERKTFSNLQRNYSTLAYFFKNLIKMFSFSSMNPNQTHHHWLSQIPNFSESIGKERFLVLSGTRGGRHYPSHKSLYPMHGNWLGVDDETRSYTSLWTIDSNSVFVVSSRSSKSDGKETSLRNLIPSNTWSPPALNTGNELELHTNICSSLVLRACFACCWFFVLLVIHGRQEDSAQNGKERKILWNQLLAAH